jgi:uncharacterized protein YjbI with pentapeptide repeats
MCRLAMFSATIMICMLCTAPQSHSDQLKTGIMKTAPSPNQISGTPTPQVPVVKSAPGVTTPVPTKQGITAPLGQKATIAVKSPAQGTLHPADKPLPIIWDRSAIGTAATVNILLVDKPGGTAKATIKAGAPNTGSFISWIAPQQYTAAGNSWAIRIETADRKASGHSGSFSFALQPVSGMRGTPSVKSGVAVQEPLIAGGSTKLAVTKDATGKVPLAAQAPGIAASKGNLSATPHTSALSPDQETATPLLDELKLGKRMDFSRASLAGLSLKELDLSGYNFAGADLSGSDMSWAKLDGANLSGANLSGADLSNAKFQNANLSGANLSNALIQPGTNFSGADFSNADLTQCDFTAANLSGANLSRANCDGISFRKARMDGVNLSSATCIGTDFSEASLRNANIDMTDMRNSIVDNTDFQGARLWPKEFPNGVNLNKAKLKGISLRGYRSQDESGAQTGLIAEGRDFSGSELLMCVFGETSFKNANMQNTKIQSSYFHSCDFTGAKWGGANIQGGDSSFSNSRIHIQYMPIFRDKVINFEDIKWFN